MRGALIPIVLTLVALAGPAGAVPVGREVRPAPAPEAAEPSYVQRVAPAVVGLSVRADPRAPSSARLGARRFGSAVLFDARGYAVTVSYVLLDALVIEATLRDGRTVPAELTGLDLESGLGVVRLVGAGPWPTAVLGQSRDLAVGALTGTVGVDEDNELVAVSGRLDGVRRFSAPWEYMLERALLVAPGSPSWGGSAVVDETGVVVGIASLRLGEAPYVNLAVPVEEFLPVKDQLIAAGRAVSRRPRPWLGLYTGPGTGGLRVEGFAPAGPAHRAGFRPGDRIVAVNGTAVSTQEEFYEALWRGRPGDLIRLEVERAGQLLVIAVPSVDRYQLLRRPRR